MTQTVDEVAKYFGLFLVWGKNFDCPIWMYFKAVGNFASWFNVPRSYEKRYTFYVYLDAALHYSNVRYKIAMVGSGYQRALSADLIGIKHCPPYIN